MQGHNPQAVDFLNVFTSCWFQQEWNSAAPKSGTTSARNSTF